MAKGKYKYHYFYKIINLINNHFYYGIHSTNNLDDGYMGSGSRLHHAYKKYGIENFKKEILKYFDTREELAQYEADVVTEELVLDENCYNISCGGEKFNTLNSITVKDKNNTYYAEKFNIIAKRRGKKRAYIAIARKILVAIYHMLSTGELFNPSDLSRVETSDKDKIKYTKNNFMQSTKQLISLGITIDELQTFLTSKISESTPVI